MNAIEKLVVEAQSAGIIFFTDDAGTPRMEAATKPDDGLLDRIKCNRDGVLQFLNLGNNVTCLHTDNQAVEIGATEFEERAGIVANNQDIPKQWVDGMAVLVSMPAPKDWPQNKWDAVLINTEDFLKHWGSEAHALGWSDNDIFGISKSGTMVRIDRSGLVLHLRDKRVSAMTSETAVLECLNHRTGQPTGSMLTFYRRQDMPDSIPLWEVQAND